MVYDLLPSTLLNVRGWTISHAPWNRGNKDRKRERKKREGRVKRKRSDTEKERILGGTDGRVAKSKRRERTKEKVKRKSEEEKEKVQQRGQRYSI